jgi:hypothetical protein
MTEYHRLVAFILVRRFFIMIAYDVAQCFAWHKVVVDDTLSQSMAEASFHGPGFRLLLLGDVVASAGG